METEKLSFMNFFSAKSSTYLLKISVSFLEKKSASVFPKAAAQIKKQMASAAC